MKTKYTLFILMALVCLPMFAQKKNKYNEKDFRGKQQIYMTEKAGLTSEEAEKFFPLYFELQDKKKALNKERWNNARQGMNPETTEKEYETIIEKFFNSEYDLLDLEKEYIEKYKKVLTNQKIYMVYKAELKFNRNMMKILQEMEDKKK
ncbi:MAG: hypothetical protein IKW37_00720 [Bacteroidaceae bacterium]|nr:hypothetical protein [Bacteroidaceae bacterium]